MRSAALRWQRRAQILPDPARSSRSHPTQPALRGWSARRRRAQAAARHLRHLAASRPEGPLRAAAVAAAASFNRDAVRRAALCGAGSNPATWVDAPKPTAPQLP